MRLMRNFGFAGVRPRRSTSGTNGKMNEVCAAMGLTSLETLEEFIAVNQRNYQRVPRGLAGVPGLRLLRTTSATRNNFQYVVLEVDAELRPARATSWSTTCAPKNVLARKYFCPACHRMEPYRASSRTPACCCRNTERLAARVVVLPTGTAVTPEDIAVIGRLLDEAMVATDGVETGA